MSPSHARSRRHVGGPGRGPARPPQAPPWPAWHAPVAILAALTGALIAGLLISLAAAPFGADLTRAPPAVALLSTAVQDLCFIAAAVLLARRTTPPTLAQFGLRPTPLRPAILWAAAALGVLLAAETAWTRALGVNDSPDLPAEFGVDHSRAALVATAALVTVLAPIAEEVLFRGFVFGALAHRRGPAAAAAITGILFGLLHIASSPLYALVPLMLFGALLCLIYQRTGSLYPSIALHAINNAIAFGTARQVRWTWQIAPLAAAALTLIVLLARLAARHLPTGRGPSPEPAAGLPPPRAVL